jgi:hypothetical protein
MPEFLETLQALSADCLSRGTWEYLTRSRLHGFQFQKQAIVLNVCEFWRVVTVISTAVLFEEFSELLLLFK